MKKILAGIVLYNPDLIRLNLVIAAVYNQVEEVLLYNNGSSNIEGIERIAEGYRRVVLLNAPENKGIAYALNQLCCWSVNKGYEWILTLDQDTICPENLIEKLNPYTESDGIGIVCPGVIYEGRENLNTEARGTEYVKACMTSASLTKLSAWKHVNGFREDYFIDFVDNEFCMKLRIAGMNILRIHDVHIVHQLGETKRKLFFTYTYHKPFRFYYIARNNLCFIKEYRKHLPLIKEYIKIVCILTKGFIVSDQKIETLRYILRGIYDANHNHMGKCSC